MLRKLLLLPMLCSLAIMPACNSEPVPPVADEVHSVDTTFQSRGVAVPATIVTPAASDGAAYPLVVMAHGHGGSRQEGGGFSRVAERMAQHGIASIRMDFPGCGDSTESFTENNLSNMLLDLQAARVFAEEQIEIDSGRVGLLGYSMGGRLVALLSEIDPSYRVMATWAPAVLDRAERERVVTFGGVDEYEKHKLRAQQAGSSSYTTEWGTQLEVGPGYFADLEATFPLAALAKFEGPFLVIYGDADGTVWPSISESALKAATSSSEVVELRIPGAGHGFGFYTDNPEAADLVVESTADFLAQRL